MKNVTDLSLFKKFLSLCAGRAGQILTLSALASDCSISVQTVQSWLSLLEASYLIFLLQPYHKNFNKRVIKSPKLYFYDTGIICSLLRLDSISDVENYYLKGALFENLVMADSVKQFYNTATIPNIYFWRDSHGHEVDCIIEKGGKGFPLEIKSGMTIQKDFLNGLTYYQEISEEKKSMLVYGGTENITTSTCSIRSWKTFDILTYVENNFLIQ